MNPQLPEKPRSDTLSPHQELSRRMRGVRFARARYRLAVSAPFSRREENCPDGDFISDSFAFQRS